MMVYVVMINDTHSDPEPEVFYRQQDAINFAREQAHEMALEPDDVKESDVMGWLYHAQYSPDSSVWVVPRSVSY